MLKKSGIRSFLEVSGEKIRVRILALLDHDSAIVHKVYKNRENLFDFYTLAAE